jgi:hypothetical protein
MHAYNIRNYIADKPADEASPKLTSSITPYLSNENGDEEDDEEEDEDGTDSDDEEEEEEGGDTISPPKGS